MPHNPTSITAWSTAQQFNSGEAATSAQYNQLVNNLSLMYARPYITLVNTAGQTLANNAAIFTGGSPTTITNSPTSLAGSITYATNVLTVPVTGLYRVTMNLSVASQASAGVYQMGATFTGGTSANNHSFYTPRTSTSTTINTSSVGSFLVQMQTGSGGTYPNACSFSLFTTANVTVNGASLPLSNLSTFVQLEYLGASNGSI
jgi:hypothetical protein